LRAVPAATIGNPSSSRRVNSDATRPGVREDNGAIGAISVGIVGFILFSPNAPRRNEGHEALIGNFAFLHAFVGFV
jgi:hypothetical protein